MLKIVKFIGYIFCYLFYPLSFLVPRSKRILVFGSQRGAFNDNAKYLYLYANNHLKPSFRPVWITTKRSTAKMVRALGNEAYWVASPKGFWFALRGQYWFVNSYTSDILFCLSGGATIVNLWHGIPWKCIEFGIKEGVLAKRYSKEDKWDVFFHPACFIRPSYVVSGGEMITKIFADSFRIDSNQCIPSGYPRNSILLQPLENVKAHIARYEPQYINDLVERMAKYERVFIYMPTWRDSQRNLFTTGMDLEALNNLMKEQNALAIMKPHQNTELPASTVYSNLVFLERTADVYCILPFTDVLITDYSSIMFDYLLMPGKGMILYQYDYDEYISERQFNFPLEGNIIGRKVTSFDELLECIRKKDYVVSASERKIFLNKFWGDTMNKDVCANILRQLNITCEA